MAEIDKLFKADPKFAARLRRRANGCLEWTGFCDPVGRYGRVKRGRKNFWTHRYAFQLANGRAPIGNVLHTCDNPPCCEPSHLREGNAKQNMQEAVARGRMASGERVGGAVMTRTKVRELRRLLAAGDHSQAELGEMFGISQPAVSKIKRGLTWRD